MVQLLHANYLKQCIVKMSDKCMHRLYRLYRLERISGVYVHTFQRKRMLMQVYL